MKIFIVGCAKSGTTLLARMCVAFDIPVVNEEVSIDGLLKIKEDVIGKRSEFTLFGNILPEKEIRRQRELMKDVIVINMYRNGVDVLESFWNGWGVWNPLIWCESIRQSLDHGDLINLNIKYEDLIEDPDKIQEQIQHITGLSSTNLFSEYPSFVPDYCFPSTKRGYTLEPIHNERINKGFNINRDGIDIKYFKKQMNTIGYDK